MLLDIKTLIVALGISYALLTLSFYYLSTGMSKYRGIKMWTAGGIFLSLGFIFSFLRVFHVFENVLIVMVNGFYIGGLISMYIGSQQFLNEKRKNTFWLVYAVVFMLIISYFTFIENHFQKRVIVFSLTMVPLLFVNGLIFLKHKVSKVRNSSVFLAVIFFIHGAYFAFRFVYSSFTDHMDNLFRGGTIESITFLVPLSFGLLWIYGLLNLINQRITSELIESKDLLAQNSMELENRNIEKDRFFSIIAHDLRGPFASIVSLSEVLSDESFDLNEEQRTKLAGSINKMAHTTNELLENLLEWSGMKQGSKNFLPQKNRFDQVMSQTLSLIEDTLTNKHIKIINEVQPDTEFFADPYMFQVIMRNLLFNAVKFTPHGGTIRLAANRADEGKMLFSVADNGIGMSPEIVNSLFKIDHKNNRLGTDGEASSGLGLLLCKEFIDKHGGQIWAESQEGVGSTFYFKI